MTPLPDCLATSLTHPLAMFFLTLWVGIDHHPGAKFTMDEVAEKIAQFIETGHTSLHLMFETGWGQDARIAIDLGPLNDVRVRVTWSSTTFNPEDAIQAATLHLQVASLADKLVKAAAACKATVVAGGPTLKAG